MFSPIRCRWPCHVQSTLTAQRRVLSSRSFCSDGPSPLVIAIDGPAASGKGTLARALADRYNLAHLDTGLLYRAVAVRCLRAGIDVVHDEERVSQLASKLSSADLGDSLLRANHVSSLASKVSAIPGVRAALLEWQRAFAANPPVGSAGVVLDGRDIGTVVLPDAKVKLFVTASTEVRAQRRFHELVNAGAIIDFATVLSSIMERDARDSARPVAPLVCAQHAHRLDTSCMSPEATVEAAAAIVDRACSS